MKARIFYQTDKRYILVAEVVVGDLDHAFCLMQGSWWAKTPVDQKSKQFKRSMSTGDLVELDGGWFSKSRLGWKAVDSSRVKLWRAGVLTKSLLCAIV